MTIKNRAIPPRLVDRLNVLAGEREGVAEVALSALPIADLDLLAAHGIIEQINDVGEEVAPVVLTEHGRRVIAESTRESSTR